MLRLPLHQTAVDGGNIMSKFIPGNQKHLTLEDCIFIQNELNKGTTFKDIARFLCKDPTTISKEVKARRISDWYHKGSFVNKKNFCVHRYHCRKTNACDKIILCGCSTFRVYGYILAPNQVKLLIKWNVKSVEEIFSVKFSNGKYFFFLCD